MGMQDAGKRELERAAGGSSARTRSHAATPKAHPHIPPHSCIQHRRAVGCQRGRRHGGVWCERDGVCSVVGVGCRRRRRGARRACGVCVAMAACACACLCVDKM